MDGLNIHAELVSSLQAQGIASLLPIQKRVWKALVQQDQAKQLELELELDLEERERRGGLCGDVKTLFDLRVCSPTGSGKTLAYALPVLHYVLCQYRFGRRPSRCQEKNGMILERRRRNNYSFGDDFSSSTFSSSPSAGAAAAKPVCVVLLPTRDLALQVHDVFSSICCGVKVGLAAGACPLEEERERFESSLVIVATPGRLRSHLERRSLMLSGMKFLVFDEVDRLLQQSYNECIPLLLEQCEQAKREEKQKREEMRGGGLGIAGEALEGGVFGSGGFVQPKYKCVGDPSRIVKLSVSATIFSSESSKTAKLQEDFVRTISGFDVDSADVVGGDGKGKGSTLKYELPERLQEFKVICPKERKPFTFLDLLNKVEKKPTICFTNSTEASELIHTLVAKTESVSHWKCDSYNSRKTPKERSQALHKFKGREINLLIASDALSRGIDLSKVKLVINYDMPTSTKNYVHRCGRTARVGESGEAITILQKEDVFHFKQLIRKLNHKNWSEIKLLRLHEKSSLS